MFTFEEDYLPVHVGRNAGEHCSCVYSLIDVRLIAISLILVQLKIIRYVP